MKTKTNRLLHSKLTSFNWASKVKLMSSATSPEGTAQFMFRTSTHLSLLVGFPWT
jgi:hypothetical protein